MNVHDELIQKIYHDYLYSYEMKHGDTVVDVGAFVGAFSQIALRSKPAKIVAIEPSPPNYRQLCTRFQNIKIVECVNKAVWLYRGLIEFNAAGRELDCITEPNLCYSHPYVKQRHICMVECDTLDNICKHLEYIDFLKMDVEGAEIAVLLSGNKTLQKTMHVAIAIYGTDRETQVADHETHIKCIERILQTYKFTTVVNKDHHVLCGDKEKF